jgi:hypothetical protein
VIVGKSVRANELRAQRKSAGGDISGRHVRSSKSLPIFATFVIFAFLAASLAPPQPAPVYAFAPARSAEGQTLDVDGEYAHAVGRDAFTITEPVVVVPVVVSAAPAAGVPDPGSAQAIAYSILQSMGLGDGEYNCLVSLWDRESGWNIYAYNASSGAYGIPQALPGDKMASVGADWATSATTQVTWGLSYISSRYDTPCGAWAHSEENGWY